MAVVVNGERIDAEAVDQEAERLKEQYEAYVKANGGESQPDQLRQWARENIVERTLVFQEANTREVTDADVDAAFEKVKDQIGETPVEKVKADIRQHMKINLVMEEVAATAAEPTEAELREIYEANKEHFLTPEQVHASHIVKHINGMVDHKAAFRAIQEVKEQLDGGAIFEALAAENSDCPDSAGDLGTFGRGQMVQEFEDVVFNMEPGQVSDVFLTQFGYHIVKLHELKPAETAPFEQVKDHVGKELTQRKRSEAMEKFVDGLKAKATIEETDE